VVLKEILNIPDDIPQDLLDKAECVVILPSVKKGAFGIGGDGRGVMICRSGDHYTGPGESSRCTLWKASTSGSNWARPAAHDLIALLQKTPKNKSDPKSLQ
jgi:lipid-binding SYLF domain-containing protein